MPFMSRMEEMAMEAGIEKTARESVIEVLEMRFEVSPEVVEILKSISDVPVLKQLHRQAIVTNSIVEFQQELAQILAERGN
jgi:hypothetical protein